MGLLGSGQDPVLAGLLSMGPAQISALKQQQALQASGGRAPSMIGAAAPQQAPDNIGQGFAGLGQGIQAIGEGFQANRERESEDAAIQQYVGGIQDPTQRERIMAMAATPHGRKFLMAGLAKQAFPGADPLKASDLVTVQTPEGPQYVKAGDALGKSPVPKDQTPQKVKLWYGDKSVEVVPGTDLEARYVKAGFKEIPAAGGQDPEKVFKSEDGMRKEYTKLTEDFVTVQNSFQNIQQAALAANGPGDISLLTGYMKMLDPGSTVREGEFATAENAQGVPAWVRTQYNRLMDGERLAPGTRTQFVGMANNIYKTRFDEYQQVGQQFSDIAKRRGFDAGSIVYDRVRGTSFGDEGTISNPKKGVSPEASQKLPKGTHYVGLDGQLRVVE